jgi:nicotinamide-nucleotide adenylyltransferase
MMSTTTDLIASALGRLKAGSTQVEFIHKPHIRWPHPQPNPHSSPGPDRGPGSITSTTVSDSGLPVSVLDSSFNPPTLAHRALALLPVPSSPTDARLLLLSVRNADKAPRPGDASPVQRVEMMVRLAREVNAAVGLVDAPAFVHKAEILRVALPAGAQLTFVQGIDTLERFLAPRYYGDGSITAMHAALRRFFAPDGDNSRIICTRRVMELADPQWESAIFESAREWVEANRIHIVDIDNELQTFSSREVRAKVRAKDSSWRQMVPDGIAEYIEEHNLYFL